MQSYVDIHGLSFCLLVEEREPRELLRRAFATHGLALRDAAASDAHGHVAISAAHALPEVPPGMERRGEADGITVWYGGGRFCLRTPYTSFLVDAAAGTAAGTVATEHLPAAWAWAVSPTLLSLLLLLRPHHYFPLHAAALVHGGVGLLASAASGSGKSTLACNLLRSGWGFLSDDTVLLHPTPRGVAAYAFRVHAALEEDSRAIFPELVPHWQKSTEHEAKRWVPVSTLYPDQAADVCIPRVLVFPELSDAPRSQLVPVSDADALHRLVAQSALVLFGRGDVEDQLALLTHLVTQASCYRLLAARDLLNDPGRSHQLLAPLLNGPAPDVTGARG